MNETQTEKIERLKKYFTDRNDVLMAFLFGSRAKGDSRTLSDWDIGVYFTPESAAVEWEETGREYPAEDRVWADLTRILETDNIDLLVLNRAPANIAETAVQGMQLAIKNRLLWLRFMIIITDIAEEYRAWAHDYYRISQRSHSLIPQDANRLEALLTFLKEQMDLYSFFETLTLEQYLNDIQKRLSVERWVENIMNASIDAAKTVLASSHRPIPSAYREAIAQAALLLDLGEEQASMLEKWVRLRNILAHEYLDIKWVRISQFAKTSEPYIQTFVESIRRFLEDQREDDNQEL